MCRSLHIETVADPTNRDPRFARNRVRHELLPLLADLSGRDPVPVLSRQAAHLRAAADLLEEQAGGLDPSDAAAVAAAPPALAAAALRRWLRPAGGGHPPDSAALARVLEVARGEARATEVGGGARVARRAGRLRIEPPTDRPCPPAERP
ncbi:MAG: hypothetical protein GEV08_08420 [Acidimicrobiia bacterium]|nr:hypothetical protein [Acidimicrobiia bacterium]